MRSRRVQLKDFVMPVVQFAAVGIGVVACVTDLRSRRIPNALTVTGAAAGIGYHLWTGALAGLSFSALGWLVGALIFIVPFALRGLGGGDVKLLAALGAWLGPEEVFWVALYTGVAGGVFAIVTAAMSGYLRQMLSNIWLLLCHWQVAGLKALPEITLEGSNGPKLAYAVPILCGMGAALWLR